MDVPQEFNKTMEEFWKGAKMEVLYPLVCALKLDSREIFNPEMKRESPTIRQLRFMIEECSEQVSAALIPIIESVLSVLTAKRAIEIESDT